MKQVEAKELILIEWHQWLKDNPRENPTGHDGFQFFGDLSNHRPHLLRFRCSGDKWQKVHGWLLNAGLVSN